MTSPAPATNDALYHLYVGSDWTGPYLVADIRKMLKNGEAKNDTFVYDATGERHLTVEALLAEADKPKPAAPISTGAMTSSLFLDTNSLPPAQAPLEFPLVIPDLRNLYQAFIGLTESTTGDKHARAHQLRKAHQGVSDALAKRQSNTGDLYALVNQIDEVADYLANRHQIPELWQLISEMEKVDLAAETSHGISCAEAVLKCLVDRAERHEPAVSPNGGLAMLLDVDDQDEHDSVATRKILLSARHEMHSAKQDVNALQEAYSQLEDRHQQDLAEANRLLAAAEKARAVEHQVNEQAMAELRALAAEIHRIATEADIVGGTDATLLSEVTRLGSELGSTDPSTLAYLAEDVLIRMVERLRSLIAVPEDIAPLREELIKARTVIAQATAIAAERDAIKQQYQEQCRSAERANIQARDREHRLRSMVTALEVTKELHQEVMGDLQSELRGAQTRVETMERELASVRGEITGSSSNLDERSRALRDEMQRMVEMRSMLEVRRDELSDNLTAAEAELAKAQLDQSAGTSVSEALIAKVKGLKQTLEITSKRLGDQEEIAKRLESELSSSRSETNELHGRSDDLTRELDEARSSLAIAKKRAEELNTAYSRLESERSSLQQELAHRKSTDTIRKGSSGEPETNTARFEKITSQLAEASKQADSLEHALTSERRKVLALAEAQVDAQKRIEDLTTERQTLRSEADSLQSERTADHARHASALSVSIRASIESESRLKEAQERITALQGQLAALSGTDESSTARAVSEPTLQAELTAARTQRDEAQQALAAAVADRDRLAALIADPAQVASEPVERTDQALAEAIASRDEIHAKLMQTVGERDRLRREFDRLKNEFDSAAVEHRTALKSARDRLSEAQTKTAEVEQQLAAAKPGQEDQRSGILQAQLAEAQREQVRLRDELLRHTKQLENLNSGRSTDRDSQLIELARATQQLSAEQERVQALSRSLVESLHAAETARSRTIELQAKLAAQSAEREQYQLECERLRRELADIRFQGLQGTADQKALRDALDARQQALNELERVNSELSQLRSGLSVGGNQAATLSRITSEQARIRTLEQQLSDAKADHLKTEQMFTEARSRLVQVSSERDSLATEVESLKSRPDYSVELRTMRRRLLRARQRIRDLRAERDQAIESQQAQAGNMQQLTGQIERLRANQRAAAEALGMSPPSSIDRLESRSFAADIPPSAGSTSRLGAALQPLMQNPGEGSSSQRTVPRALTRRFAGADVSGTSSGFTSAFGRPSIPGIATSDLLPKKPIQTRVFAASDQPVKEERRLKPPVVQRRWIAAAGIACLVGGILSLPPLLPYSSYGLVTARLITLKAPIDGKITYDKKDISPSNSNDLPFAEIDNDTLDSTVLDGLTTEMASLVDTRTRIIAEIDRQKQQQHLLAEPAGLEHQATIDELFRWRSNRATPGIQSTSSALIGAVPPFDPTNPPPSLQNSSSNLSIFNEAEMRISALTVQSGSLLSDIKSLHEKVDAERERLGKLRHATMLAPQDCNLWRRQTVDHGWVHSGDQIASFTDPKSIIIEALIAERYLDRLAIGDQVKINLLGEKRSISGKVKSLLPLNQAPENQAGSLPRQMTDHFILIVEINGMQQWPLIGQGTKLIVLGQNPGVITRMMAWFYEATRL